MEGKYFTFLTLFLQFYSTLWHFPTPGTTAVEDISNWPTEDKSHASLVV